MTNPILHHVNLKTTRLQEMIEWYGVVVGMTPHHVAPIGAWLTNDAANHRLALLAFPGMSDDTDKDSHTGIHHTAFEFFLAGRAVRQLRPAAGARDFAGRLFRPRIDDVDVLRRPRSERGRTAGRQFPRLDEIV
jgi:hypothetical protein